MNDILVTIPEVRRWCEALWYASSRARYLTKSMAGACDLAREVAGLEIEQAMKEKK